MVRRTTVLLDDDVYESLVREAVRRYGTAKALSRVVNEVLREALIGGEEEVLRLIYSEKVASINEGEFVGLRRGLGRGSA